MRPSDTRAVPSGTRPDQASFIRLRGETVFTRLNHLETGPIPDPSDRNSPRLRYRRAHRLSGQRAYAKVFRDGRRFYGRGLVVVARGNGLAYMRLGLSVGRRAGGAVVRSRLKRVIRESFRLASERALGGLDVVVIPRIPADCSAMRPLRPRLARILAKAHQQLVARTP